MQIENLELETDFVKANGAEKFSLVVSGKAPIVTSDPEREEVKEENKDQPPFIELRDFHQQPPRALCKPQGNIKQNSIAETLTDERLGANKASLIDTTGTRSQIPMKLELESLKTDVQSIKE